MCSEHKKIWPLSWFFHLKQICINAIWPYSSQHHIAYRKSLCCDRSVQCVRITGIRKIWQSCSSGHLMQWYYCEWLRDQTSMTLILCFYLFQAQEEPSVSHRHDHGQPGCALQHQSEQLWSCAYLPVWPRHPKYTECATAREGLSYVVCLQLCGIDLALQHASCFLTNIWLSCLSPAHF